jgi:hypothetical protein
MNFATLINQLNAFGSVEYLGYNGDDETRLVLSMNIIENSVQTIEQINALIVSEFSIIEYFSLNVNDLKAVYLKQII